MAGGQPLVHLDAAHLLERINDGTLISAQRKRDPGVMQHATRTNAVSKISLRGGAEAGSGSCLGEYLDVSFRYMGRVYHGGAWREHVGAGKQLRGGATVRRCTLFVLGALFGQVHVQRQLCSSTRHRIELIQRNGPNAVDRRTNSRRRVRLQGCQPSGPRFSAAVAEPFLNALQRLADATAEVARIEQRQSYACAVRGFPQRLAHGIRIVVRAAAGSVVQVVELAHGGEAGERRLGEGRRGK